jgi:hypothetical protein
MRIAKYLGMGLVLLLPLRAAAGLVEPVAPGTAALEQEPSPNSDRPSFSESWATVPEALLQVEFGAEFGKSELAQSLTLPLVQLRYGLSSGFELRLGIPSVEVNWPEKDVATTDLGSLVLGVKYVYDISAGAALGISPYLSVPLKGEQYDSVGVGLGAKLVFGADLTDWLSMGANLGIFFAGLGAQAGVSNQEYLASLIFGFGLSDEFGLFLETWTNFSDGDDHPPWVLSAGMTYLVLPRLQLDLYLGMNLLDAPEDIFAGLGGAYVW